MNRRGISTWLLVVAVCLLALGMVSMTTAAQTGRQSGADEEPNDHRSSATAIEEGTLIDGLLNESDQQDWYKFEVGEDGQAIRAGRILIGAGGTEVALYDAEGNKLAESSGDAPLQAIGAIADTAGTYYVRASIDTDESGSYQFRVKTASSDEFEPNGNRESAAAIEADSSSEATLFEGEKDWYAIDASEGETLSAAVRSAEAGSTSSEIRQTFRVELRTPDGEVVAENRTRGVEVGFQPTATVNHVAEQSGTYYVRIVPTDEDAVRGFVGYSLTAETNGGAQQPTDTTEPTTTEPTTSLGNYNVNTTEIRSGDAVEVTARAENLGLEPETINVTVFVDGESVETKPLRVRADRANDTTFTVRFDQPGEYEINVVDDVRAELGDFEATTVTVRDDADTSGEAETSNDTTALVIVGGSPGNKVNYEFTYTGSVERSGESHGAPIAERHVTVDPDVDEITDSRVSGRLGGGGDAYLLTGDVTGLNLAGDAGVYLNGEEVDPDSFGGVPDEETPTPTDTSTPTATATKTATPTRTSSPPPETATATKAIGEGSSSTVDSTAGETATDKSTPSGKILGETATDTSAGGPGFDLVAALVALLATTALAVQRR